MKITGISTIVRDAHALRKEIEKSIKELEETVEKTSILVVLLGAGGQGLAQRRTIARKLTAMGIVALIPEDDFPRHIAPSLVEKALLSKGDVELIFVNVESWGSVTEFGQFHEKSRIAPKLRVIVDRTYHPLYGSSKSYTTDLYMTHTAVYGHVYAYDDARTSPFPSPRVLVTRLTDRFRQWKALKSLIR